MQPSQILSCRSGSGYCQNTRVKKRRRLTEYNSTCQHMFCKLKETNQRLASVGSKGLRLLQLRTNGWLSSQRLKLIPVHTPSAIFGILSTKLLYRPCTRTRGTSPARPVAFRAGQQTSSSGRLHKPAGHADCCHANGSALDATGTKLQDARLSSPHHASL